MDPVDFPIRAGECPCPGTPHTEEHLYLEPELTVPMAAAGLRGLRSSETDADIEAELTAAFLPRGIRSWTFLDWDDDQKKDRQLVPVDVSREAFERLVPFDKGGYALITKAGELWLARFMRPLVEERQRLSARGRTDNSTSPNPEPGSPPPVPSRRSSPNGSAGRPSADRAR